MNDLLRPSDTVGELAGTAFSHEADRLRGSYSTTDFLASVRLLDQVADAAEAMNHHPDVELGYGRIAFILSSHDAGGVTERDVALAKRVHELADAAGATPAGRQDG